MRAVITGATGGIGSATAEALGKAGYEVIITGRRKEELDQTVSRLTDMGIQAHGYLCDATNEQSVNDLYAELA